MSKTGVESVVRLRPPSEVGRFGERGEEDGTIITGCTLIPGASLEESFDAATVTSTYQLVLPPRTDLVATDRVLVRDLIWDVIGEPADYRNKRGVRKALVATIRRSDG